MRTTPDTAADRAAVANRAEAGMPAHQRLARPTPAGCVRSPVSGAVVASGRKPTTPEVVRDRTRRRAQTVMGQLLTRAGKWLRAHADDEELPATEAYQSLMRTLLPYTMSRMPRLSVQDLHVTTDERATYVVLAPPPPDAHGAPEGSP